MAARTVTIPTIEIGTTFSKAWEIFQKKWAFIYLVGVVTVVANMLPSLLLGGVMEQGGPAAAVFLQIVLFLWNSAVALGAMYLMIKVSREQTVELSEFTTPMPYLANYILGTLAYSIIAMIGFILLIVP